jgi:hypothetical protein
MNTPFFLRVFTLFTLAATAFAAPPDVSGKWKWNFERSGESLEIVMNLKQEGSKITGKITAPEGRELEVREGKVSDDGKVAFNTKIDRDDGSVMQIDFSGKAAGDTITGKTEYSNRDGEKREREWIAKREKQRDLSGAWTSTFTRQDGTPMDSELKLKQSADKLSGTHAFNNGTETEIQEGKIQGDEVSFKLVRERDGRTVTSKYRGKLQADNSIKGQVESDWSGEVRRMDWEAKKQKN